MSKGNCIASLKPLPKGGGIHLHNAVLYKGLGSHQLIVAGIVHNVNDTTLAGDTFRSPGIIAGVKSQSSKLLISSTFSNSVDMLASSLSVCWWSAKLVFPLSPDCFFLPAVLRLLSDVGTGKRS